MTWLLLTWMVLLAPEENDHPLVHDKTGIEWTFPFNEARKKASEEKRILMIKPVAFGTTHDGNW